MKLAFPRVRSSQCPFRRWRAAGFNQSMKSFVELGNALLEIGKALLYKEHRFERFDDCGPDNRSLIEPWCPRPGSAIVTMGRSALPPGRWERGAQCRHDRGSWPWT